MIPYIYLGNVRVSTYSLMLLLGAISMLICLWKRRNQYTLSRKQCVLFIALLTLTGVAGAKLLFILEHLQDILDNNASASGVSFFGSVFLIPLLMPVIGLAFKLRPRQTLDICAPCVSIMIGCLRVGCFLSGCCGGWEVCLGGYCFRWPTQAIESIGDFAILGLLLRQEEQTEQNGSLYPAFMVIYSAMRFFLEFLRDTDKSILFMSNGQWFALLSIAIGSVWLIIQKRSGAGK